MNFLDLVLVALVAASAVHGLRLGATVQVMSYGGFWLGLFLGAVVAPPLARLAPGPTARTAISLIVLLGMAFLLGLGGRRLGDVFWRAVRRVRLGSADAALGAVVAVAASLLAAWLLASILVNSSTRTVSSAIQGSAILRALDGFLPPAPAVFSRIQAFVNSEGFPQVFAQLAPASAGPVALPSEPEVRAAVAAAGASTVQVTGEGCGDIQEGSGFVAAPGLVVTNAHVVAGVAQPVVNDATGRYRAQVVLFDPRFDLAVLRVRALDDPALRLDPSMVGRGAQAAALGYPGGGPFLAVAAGVTEEFDAEGRDIYGQGLTLRPVYQLQAVVRPGNSGGPLVEPDGTVIGVVFSRSASNPDIGYALASPGVLDRVQQAELATTPVGTGPCITGG